MPSILSPRLRWRAVSLPLLEVGLDPIERAQRVIAGSLTLWSSRIVGFQWADHPGTEMAYRYCVARINGDRQAPRPTAFQLRSCLAEVGDAIDAEAYQALNILVLSIDSNARSAALSATDFFDLDGRPTSEDSMDDQAGAGGAAQSYGAFGEPPGASFARDSKQDSRQDSRLDSRMDSRRDSRDARDSVMAVDNPPSRLGQVAADLRSLVQRRRAERHR